jgi:hypothetical protein
MLRNLILTGLLIGLTSEVLAEEAEPAEEPKTDERPKATVPT